MRFQAAEREPGGGRGVAYFGGGYTAGDLGKALKAL